VAFWNIKIHQPYRMYKKIELPFCSLEIYESSIVGTINEGVNLCVDKSAQIIELAINHFQSKPFVYIANRKHSYSVDPIIYKYNSEIKTLSGFAIVTNNVHTNTVDIEKIFSNKPLEAFSSLKEAMDWTEHIL